MMFTAGRFARLSDFFDVSAGSAGWRFIIWRTAVRIAADRPVLGWGPNSMRFVYPSYRSANALDSPINMGTVADMHNLVLNTAASLGVAGVVALLACVVMTAIAVWRAGNPRAADATRTATVGVSLAGFFVAVLFHYPTIDSGTLAAVLLGVLVSFDAGIASSRSGVTVPAKAPPRSAEALAWRLGAYALSALLIATTLAAASLVGRRRLRFPGLGARARGRAVGSNKRRLESRPKRSRHGKLAFRKIWATAGTSSASA